MSRDRILLSATLAGLCFSACSQSSEPLAPTPPQTSLIASQRTRSSARVTFIIDDGRLTDYTVKYPLFRSHGAVAVAAVPSVWRELSDDQLLELQANGWEIAAHGRHHRQERLLGEEELTDELLGAKTDL